MPFCLYLFRAGRVDRLWLPDPEYSYYIMYAESVKGRFPVVATNAVTNCYDLWLSRCILKKRTMHPTIAINEIASAIRQYHIPGKKI